ncbi:peptidoglycan-binding domain-containing protein [Paractinoplanes rishiriensis]|uniref:Peptidoglycan binding-like domain-containing protein n=1 Tax=Paractinoplanes rishiriensis TaxID=1050105 RepID=A0A919JVI5_9ACTN|nr:peptidoglycan-binding domain-containing protein [Actinoplanes rishiriensis]GIE95610.1 hypothetical protein Ari01nite_30750 [Actinoplanes rishiriensis]
MNPAEDRLRRARRGWLLAGGGSLLAVLVVAASATAVGRNLRSPAQLAADAEPPAPSAVTAAAERRVLAEPVVLRGRIQPGASVRLALPAAAAGPNSVVTKVPVRPGTRLREGRVVLERSGEPLFLLVSPFPLYRDLTDGVTGPDVTQVQRALRRLGYGLPVTGAFDKRTQNAVAALYTDRGYRAPTKAPTTEPATAPAAATPATVSLPQAHVVVLGKDGQRISAVNVRVGTVLTDPKTALFDLDRAAPALVAVASAEQVALLAAGQKATATDEGAGLKTTVAIGAIGDKPVEAESGTGFEVRFRFTGKALASTGQRTVRVDVEAAGEVAPVLAVPVTAIFSRADGSTFVTVDGADVPVRTGRVAAGWVEIVEPDGRIAEGTAVVVGESR